MELKRTLNKKLVWPINALLFNLMRLYPRRNKNLWVFGANGGKLYDGNSRYLFEYVNHHHNKKVRAIWLSGKNDVVNQVRELGYEAYRSESGKGKSLQMKAGVCFYTHSLNDFGRYPLLGGSTIVALWHGVGFKKVYDATYTGVALWMKKMIDYVYARTYRSMTIVTSEYTRYQFALEFNLAYKDIYICGQPRNDVLKKKVSRTKILQSIGIDPDKKVIFYMPTYRMPSLGKNAMKKIIEELYSSEELNRALNDMNGILVVKPHPMSGIIELPCRDNFMMLHYKEVMSNQHLLCACDMLISDYSSVSVDFALLQRPIVFYLPDEASFLAKSEPVFEEFFEISALSRCQTPSELAEQIKTPTMAAVNKINELFEAPEIRDTCYSENVYQAVCKKVGL